MKLKQIIITGLLISPFIVAQAQEIKLQGKISNAADKTLYLEYFVNSLPYKADSVKLKKNGKFSFPVQLTQVDFYRIGFDTDKNFALLILHPEDNPFIEADGENINETYQVTGSKHSQLVKDYLTKLMAISKFQQETMTGLQKATYGNKQEMQQKMDSAIRDFIDFRDDFIEKNSTSLAVIITMGQLNRETDVALFRTIEKGLGEALPGSSYHESVKAQLVEIEAYVREKEAAEQRVKEREKATGVGVPAPELNLPDRTGKIVKMEEYKDKYLLIDFWASWCGPCRKDNPHLVSLYEKYKKAGFEILSVSLDNNKDRWLGAIEQDKLTWEGHVSDLKQWNTSVRSVYDFSGIPYTVLVDNEGNIMAKGLRGPQLEKKLREIFGF